VQKLTAPKNTSTEQYIGDNLTVITDRYFRSLKTIDTFIDRALDISPNGIILSGFDMILIYCMQHLANTYLETVSRRADSIHLAIKQVPGSSIYWNILKRLKFLELDFNFPKQDVILAFDYTEEDFYGDPQGFWIYGWTGEKCRYWKVQISHMCDCKVRIFLKRFLWYPFQFMLVTIWQRKMLVLFDGKTAWSTQ